MYLDKQEKNSNQHHDLPIGKWKLKLTDLRVPELLNLNLISEVNRFVS